MAKKPAVPDQQLGFDFSFTEDVVLDETIETINRIHIDAVTDTPDLFEGIHHVNRTIETTGIRTENTQPEHTEHHHPQPIQPAGLENTGSMGIQHLREIADARSAGQDGAIEPIAGTADTGTDRTGSSGAGLGGTRSIRDESHPDGTQVTPQLLTNHVIDKNDHLGQGGAKSKYKDNIAAIRLIQQLHAEARNARPEEQRVLVKYVGWGGIPQVFDHKNTDWHKEFLELSSLLPKEEYEAARRSTQDAHYTAQPVIEAIYTGLTRLGYTGGRLLEPSVGTGHFIGLLPESVRNQTEVTGIELDGLTAQIAQQLYPKSNIINKGYQEVMIPEGYFDVVVGNPPFGNQSLFDPQHRDLSEFSIHNYFIAKSLDKVRQGGMVAVVVSSFFMDAQNRVTREWIAERAHLVAAMRLPNTAFKENALTEVTTDIVFLQKIQNDELPDRDWIEIGTIRDEETGAPIPLNQYYVLHPEMILGKMALKGTMYREDMPTCLALPEINLVDRLATALTQLPEGRYHPVEREGSGLDAEDIEVPDTTKIGAFFLVGDRIARRLPDLLDRKNYEWVNPKNEKAVERIKGMMLIGTALRELMAAERTHDLPYSEVEKLRADLNQFYDRFVKRHGYISALPNKQVMREDPDYPLLHSLERDYDRGISKEIAKRDGLPERAPSALKATIFSKRVINPQRTITVAGNAREAMLVSLNECGRIDLPFMVRLTHLPEPSLIKDLTGLMYRNPVSNEWESADQYLTGNVKTKLKQALEAVGHDIQFETNVEALRGVQPADIEPVDIGIQLGSTWVPARHMNDFVTHVFGAQVYRSISYQPALGKWISKIGSGDHTTMTIRWGTVEAPANEILEAILANKSISVKEQSGKDDNGNPIYAINEEKTAVANQKGDELKQAFLDWVWDDQARREELARIYNDTFNTNVEQKYDGSHLTLPGASLDVELRKHQKDAIWRGVQDGTGLFDHVVGAGKTFVKIGVAMESRRMGLMNKPMLAVPNHLLIQWKDAFYSLYPAANVLVAEKSDFLKENREKLFARIATGDWDAVIVGHSSLKKIGMPQQTLDHILSEQVNDLTDAVVKLKAEHGDRITIKNLEKMKDRMEAKLERAAATGTKDKVVTFDELGVDALFVDESHEFKNLFINTSLSRVSGLGDLTGSDKAFDLFVKARYLQTKYEGRGLFFGTGTPISNTIAEMYTIQRYMQYEEMKERGIVHFDAWASTFGQVVTGWELDATGTNYKLNSRFSKFQNVPELIAQYRTFADVISKSDLDRQAAEEGRRFPVPKIKGGKPLNIIVDRSPEQAEYMGVQRPVLDNEGNQRVRPDGSVIKNWNEGSIIYRMEHLPSDPRIDNPLKITNDARKAGLDFRLVDPSTTDFEGSKINEAVSQTLRIWKGWEQKKGTQLIFCDLSTPKANSKGKGKEVQLSVAEEEQGLEDKNEESEASVSMDELLASSNAFSVYEDIKQKLIAQGIPEQEIRFIHDAKTDIQKSKLFEQVNRGEVRILIGSTQKMGAGTNVQRKLVAEHHIDAPWRPSDLEQREGRILRQGNEFYEAAPDDFEVELIRYATKQTYDARMWQTIEFKAAGIEQFRKGDSLQRTIEDIAGEAANAAEMKAAATGNPLIFMQVQITAELKKVEASYSNFKRNQHAIQSRLSWLEGSAPRAKAALAAIQDNIDRRNNSTTDPWSFMVGQRTYHPESKDALLSILMNAMHRAVETQTNSKYDPVHPMTVGRYRGFDVEVHCAQGTIQFSVKGDKQHVPDNLVYRKEDKFSINGLIQRLDNFLESFEGHVEQVNKRAERDAVELQKIKTEFGKPFAEMAKLEMLRRDASEVLLELKKMQADDNYVSTWKAGGLQEVPKGSDTRTPDLFAEPSLSATETKFKGVGEGGSVAGSPARAIAFDTLRPDEAIKQHPELAKAYKILIQANEYATNKFVTPDEKKQFLVASRNRISAELHAGRELVFPVDHERVQALAKNTASQQQDKVRDLGRGR